MTQRKSQSTIINNYQQLCFVPFHLGSPKAIARLVLGKIGGTRRLNERGAVSPCDRVADDSVPFHRAIVDPLSRE